MAGDEKERIGWSLPVKSFEGDTVEFRLYSEKYKKPSKTFEN